MTTSSTGVVSRIPTDPLSSLRQKITDTIDPLMQHVRQVALIEFPAHSNVGDSAIWLGETAYLRDRHAQRPVHTSDMYSYSKERLQAALHDGAILVHGGGSLGDIWNLTLEAKIRVLDDFPDLPIVQLPQTIQFQDPARLDEYRRAVARHRHFTLLARDQAGFDLATETLDCDVRLCPDMALWLHLRRPAPPRHDVVFLRRTDREATSQPTPDGNTTEDRLALIDWLEEPRTLTIGAERLLTQALALYPRKLSLLEGRLLALRDRAAGVRVRRGCALLSSGKVVVTDRLHGHILCVLMGIPHVLLDNSYGKLRRFYDSWTKDCREAHFASTIDEALDTARALAATTK